MTNFFQKIKDKFITWKNKPRVAARFKTPTILQMEAVECGAASLAMVMAGLGRIVPLEILRAECGVSRDGSKASNILKAAKKYGLVAKGFKKEPQSLRFMKGPMIVHWNFNHFIVLEGFKKNKAFLNDPATGRKTVNMDEFDQAFTGVVLTFEKGSEFQKGGKKRSLIGALKSRLTGSSKGLLYVILAGLTLVIPGLIIPVFSKIFVDDILIGGSRDWIRPLLLMMGITAMAYGLLTWMQQYYLKRLEMKLASTTSGKFFWHVLRLPFEFFTQRFGGEIGSRVAINDRIARLLSGELATATLGIISVVFYTVLMFQYDLQLTLICVSVAFMNIAALQYVSQQRKDANQRLLQESGKLMGVAMGGLQTIESLKATGAESDFFNRWAGYFAKVINAKQKLGLQSQVLSIVPPLLIAINAAVILGVGSLRIMDGYMSMGMLVAYQALVASFINPVQQLVNLGGTLQEVEGDMNRLDDVLRYGASIPAEIKDEADPTSIQVNGKTLSAKLEGFLELQNISFGYSRLEAPLIENFSLSLKPGMRVALVGGSGSGKSTVAKLVCGLYEPWSGEVLFDGVSRKDIPRTILNNSFAVVDQDIFLFEDSIHQNLSLWDETVSEADVVQAAKDAAVHEIITARNDSYNSIIEEGGRNFSGGQRQRLEIARALAFNPSIMVLDEATSALDPNTEKEIDDNLRRRGCTCLIIAHRLSTVRDADEIIVMDRGKIVQRGTHEKLVEEGGLYAKLINTY